MKCFQSFCFLSLLHLVCFGQTDNIRKLENQLTVVRDSTTYVDALNRLAMLFYEQNPDSTAYYATKAREIAGRIDYARGIADATNNMGVTADVEGDGQTALRYYNEAYNEYIRLNDSSNLVQVRMNMGLVYGVEGKPDKAKEQYRLAFDLFKRISYDSIGSLLILNYLIQFPDQVGRNETNAKIDQAINIANRYRDKRSLLALQQLRATCLIDRGMRDSGISILQHAALEGEQSGLFYMTLDIQLTLADLYIRVDSAKGIDCYKHAFEIANAKKFHSYEQYITDRLLRFYSDKKDTTKAFYYSQTFLRALLEKQENDKQLGIDYLDYAKKDLELAAARKQSAYNAKLFWLAAVCCTLAAAIILLLWRNSLRKRRTLGLLKEQYARLETLTESLEQRNRQYARLLQAVAHDLRNPINGIRTISKMMLLKEIHSPEMLKMINETSSECLHLIGELLDSDLGSKKEIIHTERVEASILLRETATPLSLLAQEKKQTLVVQSGGAGTLEIDKKKIRRVIDNLVMNAIKFSPAGSAIELTATEEPFYILFGVRDEGIGIPMELREKLFDPFTSAKRVGTEGEQSFGLGLFICKQIVEAHCGEIWFESEENKGSTFFIRLPRDISHIRHTPST